MNAGHLIAQLPTLFDRLERAGFTVAVQSRLAVHDLLLRLTVENSLPSDAGVLGRMIGPILCTSPSEQEQFELIYHRWREQVGEREETSEKEPDHSTAAVERLPRKHSKGSRSIFTGCAVAVTIALAVWINERRFEVNRPTADFKPLSKLESLHDHSHLDSDERRNRQHEAEDPKSESSEDDAPAKNAGNTAAKDATQRTQQKKAKLLANTSFNAEKSHEEAESDPRFALAAAVTGIGLGSVILAICAWWALTVHRRKRYLVKRSVRHDPEMTELAVNISSLASGPGKLFWRTAQRFRQHITRMSPRLDIARTAARTAANGGLFTAVHAKEKVSPSYLILIESDGRRDQQTKTIDNLVDQFESEGVAITRYYFRGDPRICRTRKGRARKLAELAASHSSERLMVFADAESFLDPMTGGVSPWVEAFEPWQERALLVAAETDSWTAAEAAMSGHFRLAPANSAGLSSLVDGFAPDPAVTPIVGTDRFPAVLREHPERWLDREAPPQHLLNKLIEQLRLYLGDAGYQWFSACAVYPTLHHRLILWTGEGVADENHRPLVDDSDLMRLSRLPWLRQGQLPDWLRARLIGDLSGEQELRIRKRLDRLFCSTLAQPEAGTTLPIARETATSRQKQRDRSRVLRDHTFVSFMSNPLGVRLPQAVGRMLPFHRIWRPWQALAALTLLALLLGTSTFLLAPSGQANSSSPQVDTSPPELASSRDDQGAARRGNVKWWVLNKSELKPDDGIQVTVRARVTNPSPLTVGDDVGIVVQIRNKGQIELPPTIVIDARYVGPFEPKGFLDGLKKPVPPGESVELALPRIPIQKNRDFSIGVKLYADSRREKLLTQTSITGRAHAPLSAGIPTIGSQPQTTAHVTVKGPTQAAVGEVAKFKIVVTNSGLEPLKNVVVRNQFDQGLKQIGSGTFGYQRWEIEKYSPAERAKINAALNRPADAPLVSDLVGHHPIKKKIGELASGDSCLCTVAFRAARSGNLCQSLQILDGDEVIASTRRCLNVLDYASRQEPQELRARREPAGDNSRRQVGQQVLPPDLRQAISPPVPLPAEQRVVPSTAGELDVQQKPLR